MRGARQARRLAAVAAGAAVGACGYLPLELLPGADEPGVDGGTETGPLSPVLADGAVGGGPDAAAPPDGGLLLDASDDAGCRACVTLYVWEKGDDNNDGSRQAPFRTIGHALKEASKSTPTRRIDRIHVASGTYAEDKLKLVEGVSLLGSWVCDATTPTCAWDRQDRPNPSVIVSSDGIEVPAEVTRATVFSRFKVVSLSGTPAGPFGSHAMRVLGSPTLSESAFVGADLPLTADLLPVGRSVGLVIAGAGDDPRRPGPLVRDCLMQGGSNAAESIGLLFETSNDKDTATATVRGGTILSGAATRSVALLAKDASAATTIEDVAINSGRSLADLTRPGASWAVELSSSPRLDRNRINAQNAATGSGAQCAESVLEFCGGVRIVGAAPVLTNNFIGGVRAPKSAGLLIAGGAAAVPIDAQCLVDGNVIDAGGERESGTSATVVVQGSTQPMTSFGRLRNNILLGGVGRKRYQIYEMAEGNRQAKLEEIGFNDFFSYPRPDTSGDFPYRAWINGVEDRLTFEKLGVGLPRSVGLFLNVDPDFVPGSLLKIRNPALVDKGTPADTAGTPRFDFEGDPRTGRVDIGADEVVPP